MIHYILLDKDSRVMQRGTCGTKEEIPSLPGLRSEIIDERDVRRPAAPPSPTYREYRAMAYPGIGAQLDALWHAMDQGLLPKIEPMYSDILAVKQKHPKP